MDVGQVVDYVIEYNDMHNPERQKEAEERGVRRSATQADWDAFLG